MDDIKDLTLEALRALRTEKVARGKEIQALPSLTKEDVAEAKELKTLLDAIDARDAELVAEQAELDADIEAIKALDFDPEPVVEEVVEEPTAEVVEPVAEVVVEEPAAEVAEPVAEPVAAATKPSAKAALAGQRPNIPETPMKPGFTLTASAGHSMLEVGQEVNLLDLGEAAIAKLKNLPVPDGSGKGARQDFALGSLELDFPDDLKVSQSMSTEDINQVLKHAADEHRLEGESLTASAGWCAPSEQLYDLPNHEVVDGILSVPEVQVNRGGFKHTMGLDWSTLYAGAGFLQTESQAISGTTKTSYEVPCPTFVDERLDAIGMFIKVPILLESGYPEMVQNVMSRAMVAHQYKVNASVLARMVTAAGTAHDFVTTPIIAGPSTTPDTLASVNLVATQLRQKYRIGTTATLEIVIPMWVKEAIREDIGNRNGRPPEAVSDAEITAHFAVRHLQPQFVWGFGELPNSTAVAFPTTFQVMIYPAGTFVKGVSNVINLSAVYDAASLAVNLYTGLFFEQGLLVAKMDYEAVLATLPVNIAGRTGAPNLT